MIRRPARLVSFLLAAACLLAFTGCSGGGFLPSDSGTSTMTTVTQAPERDCVLIGRVVPASGPLASFGSGTPYVEQRAIDYINETYGGVYVAEEGRMLPLRLIYADSESSITRASEAAVKLIQEDGVDLMIVSNTADTVRPVAAACESYGVPCISVDAPVDVWLAGGPYRWSYHAFFDNENELSCLIDAWDLADCGTLAGLIAADDFEGLEIAEALPAAAAARGYTIYDPGRCTAGQTDYRAIITRLRDAGCPIVAGVLNAVDFAAFWQQCEELGYRPKVCTVAKACLFAEDVAALGESGDGLVSEVWWSPEFPGRSSLTGWDAAALCDDYRTATGSDIVPATVGYKHANVELLYNILCRAGSLEPQKILDAIAATDLETIVGRIRFKADHTCIMPCVTGQWRRDADGNLSLKIIAAGQMPDVPLTGSFQPLN